MNMNENVLNQLAEIEEKNNGANKKIKKMISDYSFVLSMAYARQNEKVINNCIELISNYYDLLRILKEDNNERTNVIETGNMDEIKEYLKNNQLREAKFEECYGKTISLNQELTKTMNKN